MGAVGDAINNVKHNDVNFVLYGAAEDTINNVKYNDVNFVLYVNLYSGMHNKNSSCCAYH